MTWAETTVGAEFEVQLGKMLDSERNNGESKLYVGNRAVQWGRIDLTAAGHVPLTKSDQLKFRLRRGDLLVCEGGEVGRGAIWNYDIECYFQKAIHRLRTRRDYRPEVLLGLLELRAKSSGFADYVTQTSIAHLPKDKFLTLPIPSIPAADQERIAAVLASANDLVASLERLIAKKRDIKQGMVQELLTGRTRMPGFSGEWVKDTLGAVSRIKTGSRNNQDKDSSGSYPFFVRSETVERIGTYSYDTEAILVPGEGGIGSIFHYINGKFEVHQRVYKISDFSSVVAGKFIYYYMRQFFGPHAMENSVKATVDSLRLPTFTSFELTLPPSRAEQAAIVEVLEHSDAEIDALERRLESTRAIKQGMMQELLTGRTRLSVVEEVSV